MQINHQEFMFELIYRKWLNIGLLEDLSYGDGLALSMIYENTALWLMSRDLTRAEDKAATLIFPLLYKLYKSHKYTNYQRIFYEFSMFYAAKFPDDIPWDNHLDLESELMAIFAESYQEGMFNTSLAIMQLTPPK
jgi:hypothetical protein